jgi:hypothetical protein
MGRVKLTRNKDGGINAQDVVRKGRDKVGGRAVGVLDVLEVAGIAGSGDELALPKPEAMVAMMESLIDDRRVATWVPMVTPSVGGADLRVRA